MYRSPVENSPQAKGPATAVGCARVVRICRCTGEKEPAEWGWSENRTARASMTPRRRPLVPPCAHPSETAVQMATGIVHLSPTEQDRMHVGTAVFPELRPRGLLGTVRPHPGAAFSPYGRFAPRASGNTLDTSCHLDPYWTLHPAMTTLSKHAPGRNGSVCSHHEVSTMALEKPSAAPPVRDGAARPPSSRHHSPWPSRPPRPPSPARPRHPRNRRAKGRSAPRSKRTRSSRTGATR
ncbi:protein of unknown function [Streptomyces sp. KY75]|nr:protein of unknown function [Streptomyces sp. KY70]CAD5988538.1 protein of unknown function [Streptomyces sp. KY75]